ncbi:MAG: gluconate 2-dehydrogenase subunit 3 family protein [Gemmatimonadota bacterium]|jgi:gluconate 2-dehydrogenase gamma chain|nr:gluconate 2-dehydrogenase subunit 3 family protein [Gemmatimonadota bacterium]MDQ8146991.1 gluconate 2-dehydrogenase subunit 3 family protein [Gemmatimonadota bacterium]MDQ8148714.1 gluconate 2-dehydrogenase subunit 3 family protein [Gemmatimonadota bacterium]MDQ8156122.1 gluconate 2-dehydrogenase subunit 3 family protein [Gemmatimonadota bacterium]MDQ8176406.1 gluconate 2-dehydrogenase subunit 3 family protein [Gemmatimonadota bacterium]
MSEMNRRDALQHLLAVPAGIAIAPDALERAADHVHAALDPQGQAQAGAAQPARPRPYVPKQFTPDEWRLVRMLVDYLIPRDARSGSATDAGVPEFMDFMLGEYASMRTWMRNGLGWMHAESRKRFGKSFVSATDAQRREILDAIAFPKRAAADVKAGVEFFNNLRNLTASGFYSSRIGIADLGYTGNRPVAEWKGTPPEVMRTLGL